MIKFGFGSFGTLSRGPSSLWKSLFSLRSIVPSSPALAFSVISQSSSQSSVGINGLLWNRFSPSVSSVVFTLCQQPTLTSLNSNLLRTSSSSSFSGDENSPNSTKVLTGVGKLRKQRNNQRSDYNQKPSPLDPQRQKIEIPDNSPHWFGGPYRSIAYNVSSNLDIKGLVENLSENFFSPSLISDIVHVQYCGDAIFQERFDDNQSRELLLRPLPPDQQMGDTSFNHNLGPQPKRFTKDVFFFGEGAIVFWGLNEAEEAQWMRIVSRFEEEITFEEWNIRSINAMKQIFEQMPYYRAKQTRVYVESIHVNETLSSHARTKEMLALSYGLVRSVKLEMVEMILEHILDNIQNFPKDLFHGKVPTKTEWRKLISNILTVRSYINLNSGLLEVPEMYWEEPWLEELLSRIENTLDIKNRITLLNKRLDYAQEVSEILRNYMTQQTSHHLEVAIVALISIEILFCVLDKSLWWHSWTWEDLLGIEGPLIPSIPSIGPPPSPDNDVEGR